jgi:murein DD-endopeptidase / murein LD-carboxypeptidase
MPGYKPLTAESLVEHARSRIGVRFLHQGRTPEHGFDCIGLILDAAWAHGVAAGYDFTGYSRSPDGVTLRRELERWLVEVPAAERRDGDVLLFRIRFDPQHVGFRASHPSLGADTVIHARAGAAHHVAEHRIDTTWERHIVGCFRFPALAL